MRFPITMTATLFGAFAAASCAPMGEARSGSARADRSRDQACFNAGAVRSFRPVGRDAVDVEVSRGRVYRLDVSAGCFDVAWADRVALRSRTGGFVCSAADAELIVPSSTGRPDRCLVTGVRRLSEAEIEASRRR